MYVIRVDQRRGRARELLVDADTGRGLLREVPRLEPTRVRLVWQQVQAWLESGAIGRCLSAGLSPDAGAIGAV